MLLDLRNIYISNIQNYLNISDGINSNLTVCVGNNNIISELFSSFNNNCSCYLNQEHKITSENYKCLYDCSQDDIYKYEYNNICYQSCPKYTKYFYGNNTCIDILCKNNFYNYNQTGCIDDIPEGYYLNDTNLNTIDKCNIECGNCSLESNAKKFMYIM